MPPDHQPPTHHRGKGDNLAACLGENPKLSFVRTPHVDRDDVLIVREGLPDAYESAAAGAATVAVLGATCPNPAVAGAIASYVNGRTIEAHFGDDNAGHYGAVALTNALGDIQRHSCVSIYRSASPARQQVGLRDGVVDDPRVHQTPRQLIERFQKAPSQASSMYPIEWRCLRARLRCGLPARPRNLPYSAAIWSIG
jgi:hypothetical protein